MKIISNDKYEELCNETKKLEDAYELLKTFAIMSINDKVRSLEGQVEDLVRKPNGVQNWRRNTAIELYQSAAYAIKYSGIKDYDIVDILGLSSYFSEHISPSKRLENGEIDVGVLNNDTLAASLKDIDRQICQHYIHRLSEADIEDTLGNMEFGYIDKKIRSKVIAELSKPFQY